MFNSYLPTHSIQTTTLLFVWKLVCAFCWNRRIAKQTRALLNVEAERHPRSKRLGGGVLVHDNDGDMSCNWGNVLRGVGNVQGEKTSRSSWFCFHWSVGEKNQGLSGDTCRPSQTRQHILHFKKVHKNDKAKRTKTGSSFADSYREQFRFVNFHWTWVLGLPIVKRRDINVVLCLLVHFTDLLAKCNTRFTDKARLGTQVNTLHSCFQFSQNNIQNGATTAEQILLYSAA